MIQATADGGSFILSTSQSQSHLLMRSRETRASDHNAENFPDPESRSEDESNLSIVGPIQPVFEIDTNHKKTFDGADPLLSEFDLFCSAVSYYRCTLLTVFDQTPACPAFSGPELAPWAPTPRESRFSL